MLVLGSCTPAAFRNFQLIPVTTVNNTDIQAWFKSDNDHFLFHSGIDVFQNHFTGLMIIKPLPGDHYRVVFINELGIKIFDMEFFGNGGYKLHYCLEYLNKKFIINTLKNDISLMLNNQTGIPLKEMQNCEAGTRVSKIRDENGVKYFLIRDRNGRIEEIFQRGGLRKSVNISFFSTTGIELDSVRISHQHIKLDIHLSKINENE